MRKRSAYKKKVDELFIKQIEEAAACGLTYKQIAHSLCMSEPALFEMRKKYPDIDIAIDRGHVMTTKMIAHALVESALGGEFRAQAFYLERKGGWTKAVDDDEKVEEKSLVYLNINPHQLEQ